MTASILRCSDHGLVDARDAETCPVCDAPASLVLGGDRRTRLSKFLSGALRHFPDDVGLDLDEAGWTPFDDLVDAATERYGWASPERVAAVVETDSKGRFERTRGSEGERLVRAAYGHSVDVDPDPDAPSDSTADLPDRLYHGTAPRHLDAIRREGLRPMNRQRVHLSGSVSEARSVGRRHAPDPVVLVVDVAAMVAAGHEIVKRGTETYTTEHVPPAYLSMRDDD